MTNNLCPLIKENCKEKECVMFRNGECIIVTFLAESKEDLSFPETNKAIQRIEETRKELFKEENKEPDWLKEKTYEDIEKEIFEYSKTEFSEKDVLSSQIDPFIICDLFWANKQIEKYDVSPKVLEKMIKAEMLFAKELRKKETEDISRMVAEEVKLRVSSEKEASRADPEKMEKSKKIVQSTEDSVPDWIKKSSPEKFCSDILEFKKNELAGCGSMSAEEICDLFWKSKGIISFFLPRKIREKIVQTEFFVTRAEKRETAEEHDSPQGHQKSKLDGTEEELANEMVEFMKKNYSENLQNRFYFLTQLFWETKLGEHSLNSREDKLKKERAESLAEEKLKREKQEQAKQKLESEKARLPSLVSQCVDWARAKGLKKKILQNDIQAFLMEKDLDLLGMTQQDLYRMANSKLKSD